MPEAAWCEQGIMPMDALCCAVLWARHDISMQPHAAADPAVLCRAVLQLQLDCVRSAQHMTHLVLHLLAAMRRSLQQPTHLWRKVGAGRCCCDGCLHESRLPA